jgi:hypothetical protein
MLYLMAVGLIALAVFATAYTRRRTAAEASRHALTDEKLVEARAEWRRRSCNVVVERSTDGFSLLKRDDNGKYVFVDRTGREWRLYWGIGDPVTGSLWDAFETRMMGLLSVPDWIGFHCERDDTSLAYRLSPAEIELIKAVDVWSGQRPHSVSDLESMLAQAMPPDRRSGQDRRTDSSEQASDADA